MTFYRRFSTADDCLSAAKYMVATQISREPAVRKCIRQTYFERAKINLRPTKKGLKVSNLSTYPFVYKSECEYVWTLIHYNSIFLAKFL